MSCPFTNNYYNCNIKVLYSASERALLKNSFFQRSFCLRLLPRKCLWFVLDHRRAYSRKKQTFIEVLRVNKITRHAAPSHRRVLFFLDQASLSIIC